MTFTNSLYLIHPPLRSFCSLTALFVSPMLFCLLLSLFCSGLLYRVSLISFSLHLHSPLFSHYFLTISSSLFLNVTFCLFFFFPLFVLCFFYLFAFFYNFFLYLFSTFSHYAMSDAECCPISLIPLSPTHRL